MWLERNVLDFITHELDYAVVVNAFSEGDGREVYHLFPRKYKLYCLSALVIEDSTLLLTRRESSTCIMTTPPLVRVKVEPTPCHTIDLSESSDDEKNLVVRPTKLSIKSMSSSTSTNDSCH